MRNHAASLNVYCQPFDPELRIDISEKISLLATVGSDKTIMTIDGKITIHNPISSKLQATIASKDIRHLPLGDTVIDVYTIQDMTKFPFAFAYSEEIYDEEKTISFMLSVKSVAPTDCNVENCKLVIKLPLSFSQ